MELTSSAAIWGLIFGMCLLNFGLRFLPLAVLTRLAIPRPLMRWLSYMPIAVMGALVATEVMIPALNAAFAVETSETQNLATTALYLNPGIYGALSAMLTYYFTKSFIGGTLAGVVVFALVQLLIT
ncbi:MAG: AzlD domain-containing protein [Coriobacteriia bacterium]|nr:AzlD domain-containing protein [Coriobacteriia bacterium]